LADIRDLRVRIGRNVVRLREQAGLTGVELAKRSGVSPSSIWKIEHGAHALTLGTLRRLASALRVAPSRIVGGEATGEVVFTGHGEVQESLRRTGSGVACLGSFVSAEVECVANIVALPAQAAAPAAETHAGAEFVFVVEGYLAFRHSGQNHFVGPGDSLLFEGRSVHGPICVADGGARLFCVSLVPRTGSTADSSAGGPALGLRGHERLGWPDREPPLGPSPNSRAEACVRRRRRRGRERMTPAARL